MFSIYAKEVMTKDTNVTYRNVEIVYEDVPDYIRFLIPDAVKLVNDNIIEYLSKSSIASIEMYKERND